MKEITKLFLDQNTDFPLDRFLSNLAFKGINAGVYEFEDLRDIIDKYPTIERRRNLLFIKSTILGYCDFEIELNNNNVITDIFDSTSSGEMMAYFNRRAMQMKGSTNKLERFMFIDTPFTYPGIDYHRVVLDSNITIIPIVRVQPKSQLKEQSGTGWYVNPTSLRGMRNPGI